MTEYNRLCVRVSWHMSRLYFYALYICFYADWILFWRHIGYVVLVTSYWLRRIRYVVFVTAYFLRRICYVAFVTSHFLRRICYAIFFMSDLLRWICYVGFVPAYLLRRIFYAIFVTSDLLCHICYVIFIKVGERCYNWGAFPSLAPAGQCGASAFSVCFQLHEHTHQVPRGNICSTYELPWLCKYCLWGQGSVLLFP